MTICKPDKRRVLILGYGAFGQAMHCALSARDDLEFDIYSRTTSTPQFSHGRLYMDPENIRPSNYYAVIITLPSSAIRQVLKRIEWIPSLSCAFVSCAKGVDKESNLLPTQTILQETGSSFIAVVSGASFSREMLDRRPVWVSLACANPFMGRALIGQLQSRAIHFEYTEDVRGLEVVGVAKNVVALAAGVAEGLGLGENFRASLIARGINETRWVIDKLGGRSATMSTVGALSDFILTCSSPTSRNFAYGRKIALGLSNDTQPEGYASIAAFCEILKSHAIMSPFFEHIGLCLTNPRTILNILL